MALPAHDSALCTFDFYILACWKVSPLDLYDMRNETPFAIGFPHQFRF